MVSMSDDPQRDVEIAIQRDIRYRALSAGLEVERELAQSVIAQIIIETFAADARAATDALILADPDARGMIAQLQARVRVARVINAALQSKIESGKAAQSSLIDEDIRAEQEAV